MLIDHVHKGATIYHRYLILSSGSENRSWFSLQYRYWTFPFHYFWINATQHTHGNSYKCIIHRFPEKNTQKLLSPQTSNKITWQYHWSCASGILVCAGHTTVIVLSTVPDHKDIHKRKSQIKLLLWTSGTLLYQDAVLPVFVIITIIQSCDRLIFIMSQRARFMGPTWDPQNPDGPQVGPMNFAIGVVGWWNWRSMETEPYGLYSLSHNNY